MPWTDPTDTDAINKARKFAALADARDRIRQDVARGYTTLFNAVWYDDDYAPQEVVDLMGATNFLSLYNSGLTLKTLVNGEVPGTIPQVAPADVLLDAGGNPVVNANGGVVLLFTLTVTGPVGATVTLTPAGGTGTPEQTATIGADGTVAVQAIAGTYTLASVLAGYADTPVTVVVKRSASVACGLAAVEQGGAA